MKFTEDEKVDLVLYFHVPISKDYKEWRSMNHIGDLKSMDLPKRIMVKLS